MTDNYSSWNLSVSSLKSKQETLNKIALYTRKWSLMTPVWIAPETKTPRTLNFCIFLNQFLDSFFYLKSLTFQQIFKSIKYIFNLRKKNEKRWDHWHESFYLPTTKRDKILGGLICVKWCLHEFITAHSIVWIFLLYPDNISVYIFLVLTLLVCPKHVCYVPYIYSWEEISKKFGKFQEKIFYPNVTL